GTGPAAADVGAGTENVVESVGVGPPGVLQYVGQDRQTVERPVRVDASRQSHDGGREPGRVNGDGAERVAEDVAEEVRLLIASPTEARNHRCSTTNDLLSLTVEWFATRTHFRVRAGVDGDPAKK